MDYDPKAAVMVSVLIKERGIEGTIRHLRAQGYEATSEWWTPKPVLIEIAGGYFAYMRGNRDAPPAAPSVFQPLPVLDLQSGVPVLERGGVRVAFGSWRSENFRNQGWMEWRSVLHVLGPAEGVRSAIKELLQFEDLPGGASWDLEVALRWWQAPMFLQPSYAITVARR